MCACGHSCPLAPPCERRPSLVDMPVRFLVTGFGQFAGVQCNPTQQLVEWLRAQHPHQQQQVPACKASCITGNPNVELAARAGGCSRHIAQLAADHPAANGSIDDFVVLSCTVLEVSADSVTKFLDEQKPMLQEACGSTDGQPVVLLHLGVDTQRNCLNLELQAYNNAQFRCSDQAGWQPNNVTIEQGAGLGSTRCTSLPLEQIADELRIAGFDCQVSHDAGRFVCNFTYHKSLQLAASLAGKHQQSEEPEGAGPSVSCSNGGNNSSCNTTAGVSSSGVSSSSTDGLQHGDSSQEGPSDGSGAVYAQACSRIPCYSLFVHVPPFTVIPAVKQQQFLLQLLRCLSRTLSMQAVPHGNM